MLNPATKGQKLEFCPACAIAGLQNKRYSKRTVYPNFDADIAVERSLEGNVEGADSLVPADKAFLISDIQPKKKNTLIIQRQNKTIKVKTENKNK
jgi:hypothetical protein